MCPQAVGLLQRYCEEAGIACTIISILDEINEQLNVPRILSVPYPMGFPFGDPNNFEQQKSVCRDALELLKFNSQ